MCQALGSGTFCDQSRFLCFSVEPRSLKFRQEYVGLLKLDSTIFDNLVGDFVNPQTEELAATGAS